MIDMKYTCDVIKGTIVCTGVLIILLTIIGCSNNPNAIYNVVECSPSIVFNIEKSNGIDISPETNSLLNTKKDDISFVIHPYNLREFYSDELSCFEYLGMSIEAWSLRCYEEGISYEEYVIRCEQFNEAVVAEEEYLHNLFYKDVGIGIGAKLENGFFETSILTSEFSNLILSSKDIPAFFICTKNEYITHFNEPLSQPN